ncbi:Spy/CpxP family protein refolding chaperone [Massilia aurea]|uniref:Spy/CpxP family protein refolding chaperone n=1 Tax=Massilia aurea TaxID=373040 RepID=UPI003462DFA4
MNTLRKHLVIAFTAAGLLGGAVGAQAQSAAPADGRQASTLSAEQRVAKKAEWQAKAGERHAKMAQKRAEHQARLQTALNLNAQQKPAWDAFVASQAPAKKGDRAGRPDRAAWASLSAPQRMEKQIAMQKARTAHMESRLTALNSFYAVLTPEQRKTFDAQAKHRKGGRHHQHRAHA